MKIVKGAVEVTLRKVRKAVTPNTRDYKLSCPNPTGIPLTAKKHEALRKMLPHIHPKCHPFYTVLPRDSNCASESQSGDRRQSGNSFQGARKQRMVEDDLFMSRFDQFLPSESRVELENAQD